MLFSALTRSQYVMALNSLSIVIVHLPCNRARSLSVLRLNEFLHTPIISHNLMSVQRLCLDNNVIVEFHTESMFIKDALSNAILTKGRATRGLYSLKGRVRSLQDNSNINTLSFPVCDKVSHASVFSAIKPTIWYD